MTDTKTVLKRGIELWNAHDREGWAAPWCRRLRHVPDADGDREGGPRLTDGDTIGMATTTDTQSPALHVADSHDLARVQGARENNLG